MKLLFQYHQKGRSYSFLNIEKFRNMNSYNSTPIRDIEMGLAYLYQASNFV